MQYTAISKLQKYSDPILNISLSLILQILIITL